MHSGTLYAIVHKPSGLFLRDAVTYSIGYGTDFIVKCAIGKAENSFPNISEREAEKFLVQARKEGTEEREIVLNYLCSPLKGEAKIKTYKTHQQEEHSGIQIKKRLLNAALPGEFEVVELTVTFEETKK